MKRALLFLTIFIVFSTLNIYAEEINIIKARIVATNYLFQKSGLIKEEIKISDEFIVYDQSSPVYYVFNIGNQKGFLIISADDHALPILGYSYNGSYHPENQPPQFTNWMDMYKKQILSLKNNTQPPSDFIVSQWNNYLKSANIKSNYKHTNSIVGPLMQDIKWGQGCLYNDTCPVDASGPCGHVYAGCVATAAGMIMKYHSHPHTGTGSYSYTHSTYGTLSANFGATTYDWANMPFSGSNENIAQLLFQLGVAVDMNYGPTGSGASTSTAVTALTTYFSYDPAGYYDQRINYTSTVWDNMVKTELDNNRPLLYRGQGSGGHAFICDGYDDDYQGGGSLYFHFNWGWNGANNGYFALTSLTPSSGHDYTNDQAAGFGIQPASGTVPNSDFISDGPCTCIGNTVNFQDQSTDSPSSWSWSNPGGSPSSSILENPSITYNALGSYDVTLTSTNSTGSGSTEVKTDYVTVYTSPTIATCMPYTQNVNNYWYGILNVTLNNLDHSTGDANSDGGCMDYTCHYGTTLIPGTTYSMEITVRVGSGTGYTNAYIDFNNDGDFTDTGECILLNQVSSVSASANSFTTSVTMPSNPVTNQLLRMRVIMDNSTPSGPCDNPWVGQSEDYGVYFESAPPVPVAIAATSVTQTSFNANWNNSSGANGYYLDVATDNSFTNLLSGYNNIDVGNVTTFSVSGLNVGTDYYYRLKAYNTTGTSSNSNVINVTTLANIPLAPVAIAATGISQTTFDANWNATTGTDGYYLDVATDIGFTVFVSGYNNLPVGNVITYNVIGLNQATDYYYRLRSYNSGGSSGNSNEISLTTLPDIPSAPTAILATGITQTSFDANWDLSIGATGYYLDISTDDSFSTFVTGYDDLYVGNVLTYNVTGLFATTDYYYRLRAYNGGGVSGNSNTISLTTLADIPPAPVATAATNISQTAFETNWDPSAGASGYYLDVATDNGFTNFVNGYDNLDVGNNTTNFVSGLNPETHYYYRVRAYNTGGTSGNSNIITATTLPNNPGAPIATVATNITQTSFDANWDLVSGAISYWIDVATDNYFTTYISGYENLNIGNVSTYPVLGLSSGTVYFYRLRAENVSGTSGNSNVIDVATLQDIPLPPIALDATNITQTSFDANWNFSTGAEEYFLDVAKDNLFTNYVFGYENLNIGNTHIWAVVGLAPETEYFYRLRACNTSGASGHSNVIFLTTLITDIGENELVNPKIFASSGFIIIEVEDLTNVTGKVMLYDLNGNLALVANLRNSTFNKFAHNSPAGMYVVKLQLNNKLYYKQLFIQ